MLDRLLGCCALGRGRYGHFVGAALIGIAAVSFVSTNIDNFLLASAQYAAAPPHRVRRITIGQLLGFALVVTASAAGAAALFEIPTAWIGALGLIPLALGVRAFLGLARRGANRDREANTRWPVAGGVITAALVTVGSSGDNLAVYIPLFHESTLLGGAAVVLCFIVFDLLLCWGAFALGRHPRTQGAVGRTGAWLTPIVYCIIGVVVLVRAGSLHWLF